MKEIEILVELKTPIDLAKKKLDFMKFKGAKSTLDIYYYDPKRENLKLTPEGKLWECCRLRTKNNTHYLTYKKDHYEGETWLYSDEHEIEISNIEEGKLIISSLGLEELVTIDNTKYTYLNDDYELVLEDVKNLGYFLEVEYLHQVEDNLVKKTKDNIFKFINSLG